MDATDRDRLIRLARHAIDAALAGRRAAIPAEGWLQVRAGVFVTLRHRRHGDLRGCIGSIEASRPLGEAVVHAATGAAFRDPRFAPVTAEELPGLRVDISVLSPLAPLRVATEEEARTHLARTKPGVVFACGSRRSVLLPKVWTSVPEASDFLEHLKTKAGLPAGFWSPAVVLSVFTCEEFEESDAPVPGEEAL